MIYAAATDGLTGLPVWVVDGPEVRAGDVLVILRRTFRVRRITWYDFRSAPQLRRIIGACARQARWGIFDGIALGDTGHGTYRILPRPGQAEPERTWGSPREIVFGDAR